MTGIPQRRLNSAVSILQASMDSPTLARLAELGRDSSARLQAINPLLPAGLRGSIAAGPIEGSSWCLLLDNSAAAAKLRQMLPSLLAHLRSKGWEVESIRLKVQAQPRNPGAR
ncbi:MAG: DciA family protein [Burkholderiaceae bacterium]